MATTVQESKSGTTSGAKSYPIYVAGEWQTSQEPLAVRNPFSGDVIGVTYQASRDQLEQAIIGAEQAFEITRKSGTYERVAQLKAMAAGLQARRDEVAGMIAVEAGKPIRDAEIETDRGVFTLETAAEEAKRMEGEVIPLDLLPSSKGCGDSPSVPSPASRRSISPLTSLSTRLPRRSPQATRSCSSHLPVIP
jgi:delta 1-pyrroline-5-carboxylate dehydrogenase